MILVFSDHEDSSSSEIIDWLLFYKQSVRRITENDCLDNFNINLKDTFHELSFQLNGEIISIKEVKSVLFRRGDIRIKKSVCDTHNDNLRMYLDYHFQNDIDDLKEFFFLSLKKNSYVIGSPFKSRVNKLKLLQDAVKYNISIPETGIYNSKINVLDRFNSKGTVMKGISETLDIPCSVNSNGYSWFTTKVDYFSLPQKFWYTAFQENIDKRFEIRSFYLDGDFYSSAIITNEVKTNEKVDFRKVDHQNLIFSAFKLPKEIEYKLHRLMIDNEINIGSIDLICDGKGEFYFLEVNPMGQFGYYGHACNYNLHQYIAEKLINEK